MKNYIYNIEYFKNYDSIISRNNLEIRISQKENGVFLLSDGSYFVLNYKDPLIKTNNKYKHFYCYTDSYDSRISLDKFKIHLKVLQELFGVELKNTLIYSKDYLYKIVDNKGNTIEDGCGY